MVYHISKHEYLKHPEDQSNYIIPSDYFDFLKEGDRPNSSVSIEGEKYLNQSFQPILTNWNGPNDAENPYNWQLYQKAFFIIEIAALTTIVYMVAAIYTPV